MSVEADIVRCAAPWPGTAARLLEGLASLGPGTWTIETVCGAAAAGIEPGMAYQVLSGLAGPGVGSFDDDGRWVSMQTRPELLRLAQVLTGAEQFRRLRHEATTIEIAVTMPLSPCHLERELASLGGRPGGFLRTADAFQRIAEGAKRRFVVMIPFIDASGFNWLRRVFTGTRSDIERILIVRNRQLYAAELSVLHKEWIEALGVRVVDYYLAHDAQSGRKLDFETFHAKILLADDSLAYVGSANLLWASETGSLETGVIIDGKAAANVARLVDGVLRAVGSVARGENAIDFGEACREL